MFLGERVVRQERQRGADGRFKAREASKAVRDEGVTERPLRPRQCWSYLRTELASEFKSIVQGFVSEARNGGCAHMKLAAELLETPESERPRRKGSAQRMLEKLERQALGER